MDLAEPASDAMCRRRLDPTGLRKQAHLEREHGLRRLQRGVGPYPVLMTSRTRLGEGWVGAEK